MLGNENLYFYTRHPNNNDRWLLLFQIVGVILCMTGISVLAYMNYQNIYNTFFGVVASATSGNRNIFRVLVNELLTSKVNSKELQCREN